MPEVSNFEWLAQLAGIGVLGTALGAATAYPIFCMTHKASLAREVKLRRERETAEAAFLASKAAAQTSPGPVDIIWTVEKTLRPYTPNTVSLAPAFPVAPVSPALTTETMVNPPVYPRPTQYKPSPSPLAPLEQRKRWEDLVGPEIVDRLTVTDVLHLEQVHQPDGEDRSASARHGFQPATA
jgi:hypothetical protein